MRLVGRTRVGNRGAVIPRITDRSQIDAASLIGADPSDPGPTSHALRDAPGSGATRYF